MELRDSTFLLFALLAPVVFLLANRNGSAVRYSSLRIPDSAPRSWRSRLTVLPPFLFALATVSLAIALAGPRSPNAETKVSREGIAIMMVVDHSGSMNARDLAQDDTSVNRLDVVKEVFKQFVLGGDQAAGRADDAVGLIAFAGYADSLCPLTLDHGNLANIVDDLAIVSRRDEDGTAIGDGLALAVERLRRSPAKSKVAIVLTDGVNNAGAITPVQAADLATASNVKVYSIGAGTNGLAPFPSVDPFSGRTVLRPTNVELDEETLREVAEQTGGQYFRATDSQGLAEIYQEIDRLERTEVSETRYLQYTEHYSLFVIVGLILLAVAAITGQTIFRTIP